MSSPDELPSHAQEPEPAQPEVPEPVQPEVKETPREGARTYVALRDMHMYRYTGAMRTRRAMGPIVEECPYPGLAAFDVDHAQWFYGRDRLQADLIQRVADRLTDGGLLIVAGPSGAGKSSLLHAGMLADIDQGALPVVGSRSWPRMVFNPTGSPLDALAKAIATLAGNSDHGVGAEPPVTRTGCEDALRGVLASRTGRANAPAARVIMVVDQFEETFALCRDSQQQRAFIDILSGLADRSAVRHAAALVILGLRADFYGRCASFPQLKAALQDGHLMVGPMSDLELRQAITLPAQDVGLTVEAGLEDLLLRELGEGGEGEIRYGTGAVSYEASRLPLLAYALRATWQRRHGHYLSVDGYRATGGIRRAIAETAERIHTRADEAGRQAARLLFLRLVVIGENTEDTRRLARRSDLIAGLPDPAIAEAVVEQFGQARLLTLEQDTVQITHEVLIRAWPRLRQWIDLDRASSLTRQGLEDGAESWHHHQGDASLLLRGTPLEAARSWAAEPSHRDDLSPLARAFLDASLRNERRMRRIRRIVSGAVVLLAIIASAAAIVALQLRASEQRQSRVAIGRQLVAEAEAQQSSDPRSSLLLDVQAARMGITPSAAESLVTTLIHTRYAGTIDGSAGAIASVAFSRSGHMMATASASGTVTLWSAASHPYVRLATIPVGYGASVNTVAFDARGTRLASGGADGLVTVWNLRSPGHPTRESTVTVSGAVTGLAFSPDGRLLAASTNGGAVAIWSADNPPKLDREWMGDAAAVTGLCFSPDGKMLATSSVDGSAILWDTVRPTRPVRAATIRAGEAAATSVAFSPDGRTVAIGSSDGSATLWALVGPSRSARPTRLATVTGHTAAVLSVAFSPDGDTIAAGSADGTAILWNVTNAAHPATVTTLPVHAQVNSVQFSPDAGHQVLAAGSGNGTVTFWTVTDLATPYRLSDQPGPVDSVAFSRARPLHLLAVGTAAGTVDLWDVAADPSHPVQLATLNTSGPVTSLAFSPNGRALAAAAGGAAVVWKVVPPRRGLPVTLTARGESVLAVAFAPRLPILAVAQANGDVMLWNVSQPDRPLQLATLTGDGRAVTEVVFSPDGGTLAAAAIAKRSNIGSAVLEWNVANPHQPVPLPGLPGPRTGSILSIAFSADGQSLALADSNGTLTVQSARRRIRSSVLPHAEVVGSTGFSWDGKEDVLVGVRANGVVVAIRFGRSAFPAQEMVLPGQADPVNAATSSFSAGLLAAGTAGGTGAVLIWNFGNLIEAVFHPEATACSIAGPWIPRSLWARDVPGLPYHRVCR